MKAFVDKDACIGCGLCEYSCPEVFKMNGEGISEVTVDEIPDSLVKPAQDAKDQCPVNAIRIE